MLKSNQIAFLKRVARHTLEGEDPTGTSIHDGNERRRADAMKKLGYVTITASGFTNWGRAAITPAGRKAIEGK